MKHLNELNLSWKLLFTSFLLTLSVGFAAAELYLEFTSEMMDGKAGLSMDDITITFHGSDIPKLRQQIYGPMKKFFTESQDVTKLKPDELADIEKIAAWVDKGAPKEEFQYDDKEKNKGSISNILNMRGCVDCHAADATMRGNKHDVPLDTFEGVYKVAQKITKPVPMDKGRLMSLSHIHLLGMTMMFTLLGMAVASTKFPVWMRGTLIVGGHGSILLDIFGWWGVREFGAPLAPMVMAGGLCMVLCFAGSVVLSLYDLWLRKPKV